MTWVALALAGGAGAVLRDRVARALADRPAGPLVATAAVNLVGAFLLGLLIGALGPDRDGLTLAVLGTGLLGGLTTFSTWVVHAIGWQRRDAAIATLGGQLVLGPLLAALGLALGG